MEVQTHHCYLFGWLSGIEYIKYEETTTTKNNPPPPKKTKPKNQKNSQYVGIVKFITGIGFYAYFEQRPTELVWHACVTAYTPKYDYICSTLAHRWMEEKGDYIIQENFVVEDKELSTNLYLVSMQCIW